MNRARAVVGLAGWIAVLSITLAFLHDADPPAPASAPDGSAYVMTAVRYLALAVGWYLAATTAISFTAHLLRAGSTAAIATRLTAAPIHRLTRNALGAALAVSTLVPTAASAQTPSPAPVMVWVADDPTSPPAAPPAPPPAAPATAAVPVDEVVVAPGDSLWSLASRRLVEHLHREPSDREVTSYWLAVVRSNKDRLRDANLPDLIYPGDRVVLPPP